ncbi:FeoA family protein [Paenibacillus lutimineralis]|uniref:Ferrous iron transport protein A n=1 Tax=Paenibacillus lutimineralis TaxID=2707005 RepID=A0A3S9V2V5_9BACL|nr:FeoA family protein [Paenibacillus lutimineralis]AZS16707.1 ferrous iron transport protein A [Paenibacillus lutimineralis]
MSDCQNCLLGLRPGISAEIRHFGSIDPALKRRLTDLGISVGSNITIKRYCPCGGPLMLECSGQLFGIRQKEAAEIKVAVS